MLYLLGRFGARAALVLAGTKVVFEGLEPLLLDHANVVVMPNHASNLDALVMFGLIPIAFPSSPVPSTSPASSTSTGTKKPTPARR